MIVPDKFISVGRLLALLKKIPVFDRLFDTILNVNHSYALVDVDQERARVLGEIRTNVASLAIAAAQKLVGEALDDKRQHALVAEFFSGIKDGQIKILEETDLSGSNAEVVSALPLTSEEQKTISGELSAKLGGDASVNFNVDPKLLGGLLVRVGDKVVDGSVAGQISDLRSSLE